MEAIDFICSKCKHFRPFTGGCNAFPNGIPDEIDFNGSHSKPIEGQENNIVFEHDEDYLTKYFSTNTPSN